MKKKTQIFPNNRFITLPPEDEDDYPEGLTGRIVKKVKEYKDVYDVSFDSPDWKKHKHGWWRVKGSKIKIKLTKFNF